MTKIKAIQISLLILSWGLYLGYLPLPAHAAQSQVQMSVSVLERKSTDTINDFDFRAVAGASTQNSQNVNYCPRQLSWFEKLISIFQK